MIARLVLVVCAGAIAVAAVIGVRRPVPRAIAVQHLRERPGRALLLVTGVLLASATLTSAVVVGGSLRSSIRRSAFTQLGPVDEEIVGRGTESAAMITTAVERARPPGIDDVLPLITLTATVRGRDFLPRVAQAQLIEVDFARAAAFGGDPATTGMSGPTPVGSNAVIGEDLSHQISIGLGHRVTVYAYGTSRTFRITRVLPRVGIAGLESRGAAVGSASPNLFLPLSTIASMRHDTRQWDAPLPTSVVAVANRGGVITSRRASDEVSAALRNTTDRFGVDVVPVKQRLLDDAAHLSDQFGGTFQVFGAFSVLGGLMLLMLTFGALAVERGRSLGILRALGLRRREMIVALLLEAFLCCVVGAVAGAVLGVSIAALVVLVAHATFASTASGGIELALSAGVGSIAGTAAIGLVTSVAVLAATAAVVSRREVTTLMRGESGAWRGFNDRARCRVGTALLAGGIAAAVAGSLESKTITSVVGAATTLLGATIVATSRRRRMVVAIGAVALISWTVFEGGRVPSTTSRLSAATLLTIAAVMSLAAVAFVSVAHRATAPKHGPSGRRGSTSFVLGYVYSHTAPVRTAIISAMYAVVVFTLCFVLTVAHVYAGNADAVGRRLGGRAALEVTSNPAQPVAIHDVAQLAGVTSVSSASPLDVHLLGLGAGSVNDVTLIGVTNALINLGAPPIIVSAPGLSAISLYQRVASDPTLVVVGADLNTTSQENLDRHALHPGDTFQLQDPTNGVMRRVHVAGVIADARYQGIDHIYGSESLVTALHTGPVPQSILYVETAPGTNNDTVAAIIDGNHLRNGAYARSFHRLASDELSAQEQFLNILAGYAALGLVAGALALGVAMTDRVRERRHQLATLRAIGLRPATLRRALRVEAALIGLEAALAGALTATLLTWRLAHTGALGQPFSFTVPSATLTLIVAVVLLSALAATTLAGRRAARLKPATALRVDQ